MSDERADIDWLETWARASYELANGWVEQNSDKLEGVGRLMLSGPEGGEKPYFSARTRLADMTATAVGALRVAEQAAKVLANECRRESQRLVSLRSEFAGRTPTTPPETRPDPPQGLLDEYVRRWMLRPYLHRGGRRMWAIERAILAVVAQRDADEWLIGARFRGPHLGLDGVRGTRQRAWWQS